MKVQIIKLPLDKAEFGKQVDGSLSLKPGAFGGADYKKFDKKVYNKVKGTTGAVERNKANLEAEGGETAFGPISGQSIPDHLKIIGKRHYEGGVPLNLPDDTFIFSDTAALKINDPSILAMFNRVPKKGGYTPAELAKPYDIQKYKDILFDPDSGKLEKNTATIMIKNYIMKLGALALVQESMKGFPQGIPEMSRPYMEANNIAEEDLMPELKEQAEAMAQQMQQQQMPQEGMPMGQAPMPDQQMAEAQYPQQMPSGAPVASPEMLAQMEGQGMPPEAMMQQPPMRRGGYMGIPYAQPGMQMDRNDPDMQKYINTMNKYYERQGMGEYLPSGSGPMNYDQMQSWEELNDILYPNDPRNIYQALPSNDSPDERLQRMQRGTESCPCMKDVIVQGVPQKICVPCEEMPMAAYGMAVGGYDFPYSQSDMGSYTPPSYSKGGLIKAQGGLIITPEMKEEIDTQWSGDEKRYLAYKRLENRLRNDETFKDQLYAKYKDVIADENEYTNKGAGKAGWYGQLNKRDKEFVLEQLLAQEKRNRILQAAGNKYNWRAKETSQRANAPGKTVNQETLNFITAHPELKLTAKDFEYGYVGQAAYRAYDKLMREIDPDRAAAHWAQQTGQDEPGQSGATAKISGIDNASTNTTLEQFLYEMDEEQPSPDVNPKAQEKVCRCTDPKTGQVSEVVIAADAICECPGMKSEEFIAPPIREIPHFSKPAKLNMLRNMLMQVNPASTNVVIPGRTQIPLVLEEYQTKVDQALAAQNQLSKAIMYGLSGASPSKQAQLKDMLGKALNASITAVSDVASRNTDRMRETNQQNATIDNTNILARTSAIQEALEAQRNRKDMRTANVNKRLFNSYQAVIDAYKEMAQRQNQNILYPQYAATYDEGFVYPTGVQKPFTGEISQDEIDALTLKHEKKGASYEKAVALALQEARLRRSAYGGEQMANGGYVLGTNVFPFML